MMNRNGKLKEKKLFNIEHTGIKWQWSFRQILFDVNSIVCVFLSTNNNTAKNNIICGKHCISSANNQHCDLSHMLLSLLTSVVFCSW